MDDLKWWERKAAEWIDRHPRIAAQVDEAIAKDKPPPWWGSLIMFVLCTLPLFVGSVLCFVLYLVVGYPWGLLTVAHVGALVIFLLAQVVVWREDHKG